MIKLTIGNEVYQVEFGYNSFCDSDLLERVFDIGKVLFGAGVNDDEGATAIGKIKDLFCINRELLYEGFKKNNPVKSLEEVGNLLDIYKKEEENPGEHGLIALFTKVSEELTDEGFLKDVLSATEQSQKDVKAPQDHKKSTKLAK